MGSIAQRRIELLQQLREHAAAIGAAALWQRFATQLRLAEDPGAVFELMAALHRACAIGKGSCAELPPAVSTATDLIANHERFLRTSGLKRELANQRNGVGFHAGLVGDFPLLASFTTPPFEEVESRVAGLHFMVPAEPRHALLRCLQAHHNRIDAVPPMDRTEAAELGASLSRSRVRCS